MARLSTWQERSAALYARLGGAAARREERAVAERRAELREKDRVELRSVSREARVELRERIERRERDRERREQERLGSRPVSLPSAESKGWSGGVRFRGSGEAGYMAVMPGQERLSAEARMAAREWCPKIGAPVFQSRQGGKVWWEVVEPSRAQRWVAYLMEYQPDGKMRVLGLPSLGRNRVEAIENAADLGSLPGYGAKGGGERFLLCVPVASA